MSEPTQDQWARLLSAVDQARADVTPSITVEELESLLEGEVRCEVPHIHWERCTRTAQWSRPANPCGCLPRLLVCQSTWEWVFRCNSFMYCNTCGKDFPISEWRKGWWPL